MSKLQSENQTQSHKTIHVDKRFYFEQLATELNEPQCKVELKFTDVV
jgi:hypothetical protein